MTTALDRILSNIENDAPAVSTKVASTEISSDAKLLATVQALSAKTASATGAVVDASAVGTLNKLAADAAAAEQAATERTASVLGAAMCDGFMTRLASWDQAVGSKVASAAPGQADLEKVAAAAYAQGQADLEKQAADQYAEGYNAQLGQIHKIASDLHIAGQEVARRVLHTLSTGG